MEDGNYSHSRSQFSLSFDFPVLLSLHFSDRQITPWRITHMYMFAIPVPYNIRQGCRIYLRTRQSGASRRSRNREASRPSSARKANPSTARRSTSSAHGVSILRSIKDDHKVSPLLLADLSITIPFRSSTDTNTALPNNNVSNDQHLDLQPRPRPQIARIQKTDRWRDALAKGCQSGGIYEPGA